MNLVKVAFPDEFSCKNVTVQLKEGDTAGSIKTRVLTKYDPKLNKDDFAMAFGSQVLNDEYALNMLRGGKELLLTLTRAKVSARKLVVPVPAVGRAGSDEDEEPEEDPPPPPADDNQPSPPGNEPLSPPVTPSQSSTRESPTRSVLPSIFRLGSTTALPLIGRKAAPKSQTLQTALSSPSPKTQPVAQTQPLPPTPQRSWETSSELADAYSSLFSTTAQQHTMLHVLSEEFALSMAISPDTFGASLHDRKLIFEICAQLASIANSYGQLCASLSSLSLEGAQTSGLLAKLEPAIANYATLFFAKAGGREVLKNLAARNTQLDGLLRRQLPMSLPGLPRDGCSLLDMLPLILQLLPDLSLCLSRVVFALPKDDPLYGEFHRCSQLAARAGAKTLASITAACRCCGKAECGPCGAVRGFSGSKVGSEADRAKSKSMSLRTAPTPKEISHFEFISGGVVVSKLKGLNEVDSLLPHLQSLVPDPIVKLRDVEEFDYFPKKDGTFSSLQPGRYIIDTKSSLAISANFLCRAYAAVRGILKIKDLSLSLGREHDLEYSSTSDERAFLTYSVSISHERPFTVVVAIDASAHLRELLDARLEASEVGAVNAKALALTRLLPFVTLLELAMGFSPSSTGSSTGFSTGTSTGSTDSKSPPSPTSSLPTLLFTGHQFGGSVAHLAALLARSIAAERNLTLEVLAVGFSPVSCLGPDLAASLNMSPLGRKHMSLYWANDSFTAMLNRCCDKMARAGEGDAKTLIDDVAEILVQGGKPSMDLFESSPGLVPVPVFQLCGQCAFLNSKGEFQPRSSAEALNLLSQFGAGGTSSVPVWSQECKFTGTDQLLNIQAKPLFLGPKLTQVTTLHTEDFIEFVFKGEGLEPMLTREQTACKLRKCAPVVPVLLNEDDFWVSDSAEVEIDSTLPSYSKVRVMGLQTATGRVCVRTDFGQSNECRISKCKRTVKASSAAISACRVDASFFLCALVRALLNVKPRDRSESKNYKTYLLELEMLLLNTKTSRLARVFEEFEATKSLLDAQQASQSIINAMASVLLQPVAIDTENAVSSAFRKLYGALGFLASGMFYVVGGVAMIPAVPAKYAAKKLKAAGEPLSGGGGLVGLPRVLFAAAERAHHSALLAIQDRVSRQYAQLLGFLLVLLNVDVSEFLDEVPTLEDEVMNTFNRLSLTAVGNGTATLSAIELWHASEEDVKRVLWSLEQTYEASQPKVYTHCPPKGQAQIERWLLVVGRMAGLRRLSRNTCVISFVGVHNAGKSTLIEKIFGFATGGDIVTRTEDLHVYPIVRMAARSDISQSSTMKPGIDYSMAVDVIDFPGASDERARIADMTPRLSHASSLFVFVFTAGHVAGPEKRIMDSLKDSRKPYLVLINKRDQIQDELNKREDALRTSYAESLGVSPDFLFFVSSKDLKDMDKLRAQIFAVIQPFLENPRDQESMACALLRPDVRKHLETNLDAATAMSTPSVVLDLMYGLNAITMTEITQSLHNQPSVAHSRNRAINGFSPIFVDSLVDSDLSISLLSMGASSLAVLTAIRLIQLPAREALNDYMAQYPEISLKIDTKTALDARFAHLLAALLHEQLLQLEAVLLSRGFELGTVRHAVEVACANMNISLDAVQDLISRMSMGQLVERKYTEDLKKMEGLNHMRMLCRFVPPSPLGSEGRKAVANVPKICDFRERVNVFRQYVKSHLEQARGPPAIVEISPGDRAVDILDAVGKLSGEEMRGGLKLICTAEDSKDILAKAALEAITGSDMFELRAPYGYYFSPKMRARPHLPRLLRGFGRLLGLVVLHSRVLPVKIAEALLKPLLDLDVTLDDLQQVEPQVSQMLTRMCCLDDESVSSLGLTFTASFVGAIVELEVDGSRTSVTFANRYRFAKMLAGFHLCHDRDFPLKDVVHGFDEVLPREYLGMFTPVMFKLLCCGYEIISAGALLSKMIWIGEEEPLRTWFVACVSAFDPTDLVLLLSFVTGLSALTAIDKFNVLVVKRQMDRLPVSRPSFKILELPAYDSADMLRDKLLLALRNGSG